MSKIEILLSIESKELRMIGTNFLVKFIDVKVVEECQKVISLGRIMTSKLVVPSEK